MAAPLTRYPTFRHAIAAAAVVTVVGSCGLGGCAHRGGSASDARASAADIYQRSTHRLSRVPAQAAACIEEHARKSGHAAEVLPLYGTESVAVTVRTSVTGDVLAVLSLTPASAGSTAMTTTWNGAVADRAAFIAELVRGC